MTIIAWLLVGLGLFWILSPSKRARPQHTHNNAETGRQKFSPILMQGSVEIDWQATFIVIDQAVRAKDYDFARTWLQKFAFTTVNAEVSPAVRERFRQLMTAFAKEDPLYRSMMGRIVPIVAAEPGVMQAALYNRLPYNQEQIRYALYFAEQLGDLKRVKKGSSYQLFWASRTVYSGAAQAIGQVGSISLTSQIEIVRSPLYERIAALHREATTHKGINWDAAINCLKEASELMRQSDTPFEVDRWTRLPVFLQQSGRFDEAMQEFERLLAETKDRVKQESLPGHSPEIMKKFTHLRYYKIYDKMRIVCKRQKMPELVSKYQHLYEQHKLIFDEFKAITSHGQ